MIYETMVKYKILFISFVLTLKCKRLKENINKERKLKDIKVKKLIKI